MTQSSVRYSCAPALPIRRVRHMRWSSLVSILLASALPAAYAHNHTSITIDDLVERVQIRTISLSPSGEYVVFAEVRGLPQADTYEFSLRLLSTTNPEHSILLSRFHLSPEEAFEADTGVLRKTAAQFIWKDDSSRLAYTTHTAAGMELRVRNMRDGSERTILPPLREIEIVPRQNGLVINTVRARRKHANSAGLSTDLALLIKDGYRFYGPLLNPKICGKLLRQSWQFDWKSLKRGEETIAYSDFPEEWQATEADSVSKHSDTVSYTHDDHPSPSGGMAAMIEDSNTNLGDPEGARRSSRIVLQDLHSTETELVVPGSEDRSGFLTILGWRNDGKRFYYLDEGSRFSSVKVVDASGQGREVYREEAGLSAPSPDSKISGDGHWLVVVRSTNTSPDELLRIDLQTGRATLLASPNEKFKKRPAAIVRFVPIDCCGGELYGRLYLPRDFTSGKKYPLVFTNYISTPGFYASVGDELPTMVLVEHGIAVFALHSKGANIISKNGDFRFEIERVARPLLAMEWVRNELAKEGVVDPERCAISGVSYGAEIAMYAYWKSKIFRAVSVATASWEPMNYFLGGINFSHFLDSLGFSLPEGEDSYSKWKQLSASLNPRADLPPLLIQSSDQEQYFGNIEAWVGIERRGLAAEWLVYPNEGHVKRSPANRWWVYQRNLDWFRFWLKNEEDPDPAKTGQYARWRRMRTRESSQAQMTDK